MAYMALDGQSNAYAPPSGASLSGERRVEPRRAYGFAGYPAQRRPVPSDERRMRRIGPLRDAEGKDPSLAVLTAHALERIEAATGSAALDRFWNTTGQGAQPLNRFLPGGQLWDNTLRAAAAARDLVGRQGRSLQPGAYVFVQGEGGPQNASYEPTLRRFLREMRRALQQALNADQPPPAVLVQINEAQNRGDHSWAARAQYRVAKDMPGVFLACPMYFSALHDSSHTTLDGRLMLSEMLADSLSTLRRTGEWQPLWPVSVQRSGPLITVQFHAPHGGPLAWDTDLVRPAADYGFQFTDGSHSPPGIRSVSLTAAHEVTVTLSASPSGPTPLLRYAWLNDLHDDGWPGGRGQLMIETDQPSAYAARGSRVPPRIRHYCVRFEEACA